MMHTAFSLQMLVLLMAATTKMAVKMATSIHLALLPCRPTCLICAHFESSCFVVVDFFQTNMPLGIFMDI